MAHLGVSEVRYTVGADGEPACINYFLPIDLPKERVAAVARIAREVSAPLPATITTYGRTCTRSRST